MLVIAKRSKNKRIEEEKAPYLAAGGHDDDADGVALLEELGHPP